MNKTFIIEGMHCNACKTLIEMELQEHGFKKGDIHIELLENNIGSLTLPIASEEHIQEVKNVIEKMEDYSITQIQ